MMQCCYNSDAQSEVSEIIPNMNVTVQQPCTSGNISFETTILEKKKWDKTVAFITVICIKKWQDIQSEYKR